MAPRFPFASLSARASPFVALTLAVACAHGVEPLTTVDAGPKGGSSGAGGGSGGTEMAGSAGDGGSSGSAGSVDLAGGGGGGSDMIADSGSDDVVDATGNVGIDAPQAGDAKSDVVTIDAGPPKHPTGITMSPTSVLTARQTPSTGGTPYNDECPLNQVLVGFRGTVDLIPDGGTGSTNLRTVQGVCAPLTVSATEPYRVTTGATSLLPIRQMPGTVLQTVTCPANQVIVGFQGRAAMYIEALQFRCAPLNIGGMSPTFTIAPGAIMTTGPLGAATAGNNFAAIDCPAGQVAVAQSPRAGSAIDSFGMVCRTPVLVLQ